MFSVFIAQIAV